MKTPAIFSGRQLPLCATAAIVTLLFSTAGWFYDGFFSSRVVANLLSDNAFLGIAAVGMTLVIFSGGIDLSVGAVMGFTSIVTATMVMRHGFHPALAWMVALGWGIALGGFMGALIQLFRLPAFLVTLAGMFLARGAGFWISDESIGISHPWYDRLANFEVSLGGLHLTAAALLLAGFVAMGYAIAHHTRFGRTLFAIGGNEQSALLMGLPVGGTKIAVYALNGFFASAAGVVMSFYTSSGDASKGAGLELDAIAVVVMGGTLLSGGRGHLFGTLLGLLIFGVIQQAILFDGRLSSPWMRIVVGGLILAFILLQRLIVRSARHER